MRWTDARPWDRTVPSPESAQRALTCPHEHPRQGARGPWLPCPCRLRPPTPGSGQCPPRADSHSPLGALAPASLAGGLCCPSPRTHAHLRGVEAFQPALCPSLAPWFPPQRVREATERPDARLPRSWAAPSWAPRIRRRHVLGLARWAGVDSGGVPQGGPWPRARVASARVRGRVLPNHLPAAPRPAGDAREPGPVSTIAHVGFCGDPVCAFPLPLPPESRPCSHPFPCRACRSLGPFAFFPVPLPSFTVWVWPLCQDNALRTFSWSSACFCALGDVCP